MANTLVHPEDVVFSTINTAMTGTTAISLFPGLGAAFRYDIKRVTGGNISSVADTIIKLFDGTALKHSVPAPRGSTFSQDFGEDGIQFGGGSAITIQMESAADCRFTVMGKKTRI